MKYKCYSEYKDSGVEWLGEVPAHWEVKRLKRLVILNPPKSEVSNVQPDMQVQFLPMELVSEDGKVSLKETRSLSDLYQGFTYFRDGDVIMAKITPCFENGKGAIVNNLKNGIGFGSTEFHVLRSITAFPTYIWYITKSVPFRKNGIMEMKGVAGQQRIPESFISEFLIAAPPTKEQSTIAAFLDEKTTQIDRLIEKKTRFIELLKEKRQALITQAVTKGLNPDVEMRDSGSTWIGKIPAHWNMKKIRHISRSTSGGTPEKKNLLYWDGDISWVTPKDMKCQFIDSSLETITEKAVANSATSIIYPGSILIVVRSGILKHTIPVAINTKKLAINQDIRAYSFDKQLHPEYFMRFVQGLNNTLLVYWRKQGATVESIETELLNASWIPVPPVLEQQHILEYLHQETLRIDTLINKTTQSIGLLKERRSALITAAVTGQIDLREAAA